MNESGGVPASLLQEVPRASVSRLVRKPQPIVVVVGPPHSGLSLCAYVLSLLGVELTDSDPADLPVLSNAAFCQDDWERQPVKQFHDRILGLFNRNGTGPLHDFALPVAWWADPSLVPIRREIAAFFTDRIDNRYFGFADPRTMRLLPVWQQVFTELNLSPKIVLCLRNPALVARSLHKHDGLDPDLAEYRWFVHVTDFFRYADRLDYCVVEYEDWLDNASSNLHKLQEFLDLEWWHSDADRELALSRIAALAGPVTEIRGPEPRLPIVRSFYELARHSIGGAGNVGRREQIVQQFIAFQQLQKPIEKALAATVAAVTEVTQERDGQAAACEALGAELASARSRLAERDAALARAQVTFDAEIARHDRANERLQTLVTALRQDLDKAQLAEEERTAALQSLRAELALRNRQNEALQASLDETNAALAAAQSERQSLQDLVAATREQLEEARRPGEQPIEALEAALQSAQAQAASIENASRTQIEGLCATLRRAEADGESARREIAALRADAEDRESAIATIEGRLAVLSDRLGEAEQQAARQSAEKAVNGAEIAALRGALAAARQVGWAAMQAATAATIPAPPGRRSGWLQSAKRRFGLVAR